MISLVIDKKSAIPIYVQIFEQMSNKINNGSIKGGVKLPSQRELAEQYEISVNTVVNAYNMLVQYEYITSASRSGYYVNKPVCDEISYTEKHWQSNKPYLYNFSRNGVDLKMNDGFKRTIRQTAKLLTDGDFTYPDYIGEYELRKQICVMLEKHYEISCMPTQIIVGAGVNYLLDLLMKVIGNDKVYGLYGFENPYYYKINDFVNLSKYKTAYLNVTTKGVTEKELKDYCADVLFLMPYHNYPLSGTMSEEQKRAVLDWAGKDRYVIEYGYDMEYVYSTSSSSMFSMTDNKNVIFINDFSRTISPGLSIAYLVLPESLVRRWQELYLNFHSYSSRFEQRFIIEVIKNGSLYRNIKRLKKMYNAKRHCLISTIENHPIGKSFEIINSKAGTFLLIKPKINFDEDKLITACHEAGVKLSYIKNSLEKPNDLISPRTFIMGFGELSENEIKAGVNLLLDTWEKLINDAENS